MKIFRCVPSRVFLGAFLLAGASCTGEAPPEDTVTLHDELLNGDSRVVLGRMFQTGNWVIDAAGKCENAKTDADRRSCVDYVCGAIAPLKPTYVSGLVRLDYDTDNNAPADIDDNVVAIYKDVKSCIRKKVDHPVRFDVVLNAQHYTAEEYKVGTANEGFERLKKMVNKANALEPDGYFFDFYSTPWTADKQHPDGLAQGIDYIQKQKNDKGDKLFVGGNVWKGVIPPGSDFVAITDEGNRENIKLKTNALNGHGMPILMHIRNDPQIDGSQGILWMNRDRTYRKRILRRHVNWQDFGYTYMFPVFFPLAHEPDKSGPLTAYDAKQDGDMLDKIKQYLGEDGGSKKVAYKGAEDARPSPYDLADDGLVTIHRGFQDTNIQHLYSLSLAELQDAKGLTIEFEEYFSLARSPADGTAPFYRCYMGNGWHVYTTDGGCGGGTNEGPLGNIAVSQLDGTVPLYRLNRAETPEHGADDFYTTSATERDTAIAYGYADPGADQEIVGYVWDEHGYAVAKTPPPVAKTPIYRAYHAPTRQHLFCTAEEECNRPQPTDLTYEGVAFQLYTEKLEGTTELYRCLMNKDTGWHLLTVDAGCEIGGINEGPLGYIAASQLEGTTRLYRYHRWDPNSYNDHFYTIDPSEVGGGGWSKGTDWGMDDQMPGFAFPP